LLRVLFLDRANVARARNVGIEEARHDTVLFGDDSATVVPTWCTDMAEALGDPAYPVVTAPVRVPVTGPVTAFLNYQRIFDAPPVDAGEARTVTGHCGLRRDRLPPEVRYDEDGLTLVGEDVAFGLAVRAAGIRIRWLGDAAPGIHVVPERIEEITERAFRYGRGAALVWVRGRDRSVASPVQVLGFYPYFSSDEQYQYRRFPEVLAPATRAAFTLYDYLYDAAYLVGYLSELGTELEHPFVDLEPEDLRDAWDAIAGKVDVPTNEWASLRLDYTRLDTGTSTEDPLVAEVRQSLSSFAWQVPVPDRPPPDPGTPSPESFPVELHEVWRELRSGGGRLDTATVERRVRAAGYGFREACAAIERQASYAAARPARARAHALLGEGHD
jgi:hypothetical protein